MSPSLKKLRVFVSETIQSTLFLRSLKTNVQLSGCFLHFPHQPDSSPFYKKIIKIKVPVYQAHSPFNNLLKTAAEECLILRKDTYQDCLVLYPESVWNEQMNELRSKLNRWNSKHQMVFRQFVSDVEIITLDGNGRFLIPKRYLKLAGIQQEVRFIGMDDTIEIWAKEIADKPFMMPEDFGKELEEIMGNNNNEGLE